MRGALSVLPGVLAILVIVGTIVFAIVAQMTDPPLEPALTFMRWQALWDDGRYGPKYTFAVTWICTLFALFGPLGMIAVAVAALRRARAQPTMPEWPRLEWTRMSEGKRARLGVALTAVGLLFGGLCLGDPEVFTPVGLLARIGLILWPFTLLAGPGLLLDVALPASVLRGPVSALTRTPRATSADVQHLVTIAELRVELPEPLWQQLKVGDVVALRRSGAFERALDLARE